MAKTKLHRTWGDAYGHMMVAIGRADIMFDPILNLWDAAALLPVVKEAGVYLAMLWCRNHSFWKWLFHQSTTSSRIKSLICTSMSSKR